jgi:exodeoxyribonuclease III
MKIISYNVNGIRAAMRKGLLEWLKTVNADMVCLQEVKASEDQVDIEEFERLGYHYVYWFAADKKGYSGVVTMAKTRPLQVVTGCEMPIYDGEGRILSLKYPEFTLMNVYFPSGSSGDIRQAFKMKWLDFFYVYIQQFILSNPNLVICGDINICHQPIDIHNPISNKNSSGFLPDEREWLTRFIKSGFIDTFRYFNAEPHQYTWWSNLYSARSKNLGWRIDYFIASSTMKEKLNRSVILKDAIHSDHCPVLLELAL